MTYRRTIPNLTPNQAYAISFRLRNNDNFSPWSSVFRFETASDGVAPGPVSNLNLIVSGSSFVATWNELTSNEDGSELTDFKDYEVSITAGSVTKRYYTTQARFDITLDINRGAFGTPKPTVSVSVRGRDLSGNMIDSGPIKSATNPPPPASTGEVAKSSGDSILVSWNSVNIDDFKEYQVFHSLDQATWNKEWSGTSTTALISTTQYVRHYYKIRAVDLFDQYAESGIVSATPLTQFGTDIQGPDTLTGLELEAGQILFGTTWNYYLDAQWNPSNDTDFSYYEYRYSIATENDWSYGTSTDPKVRISNLAGGKNYDFQVRAIDLSSNPSNWLVGIQQTISDTFGPKKPAVPLVAGDTHALLITHRLKDAFGDSLADDTTSLRVYSGLDGFAADDDTYLGDIPVTAPPSQNGFAGLKFARPVTSSAGSNVPVFVRIIAVDGNGNESPVSDQTGTTVDLITNANIADATIANAKIIDLEANKLRANSAFTNNLFVQSKLTVSLAGSIESENFSSVNRTGYRIANNTLTMYDGTISAKAIELQDSAANMVPAPYALFDYSPSYYLNNIYRNSNLNTSIDTTTGYFGNTSLKVVRAVNSTTESSVILWSGLSKFNLKFEPNSSYVISMYVLADQPIEPGDLAIGVLTSADGISTNKARMTSTIPAGVWTRIAWSFENGEIQDSAVGIRIGTKAGTWRFDGIQVERRIGKLEHTASQFKLPGVTKIDGNSITTGEISSTLLNTVGDITLPAWSINLQGNAMFSDALIRGKVVVGGSEYSAVQKNAMSIQSYNYLAGSTGWAIKGNGDVEFSNGVFRGAILGAEITGSLLQTASSGPRIVIDPEDAGSYMDATYTYSAIKFYGSDTIQSYLRLIDMSLDDDATNETVMQLSAPSTNTNIGTSAINLIDTGTIAVTSIKEVDISAPEVYIIGVESDTNTGVRQSTSSISLKKDINMVATGRMFINANAVSLGQTGTAAMEINAGSNASVNIFGRGINLYSSNTMGINAPGDLFITADKSYFSFTGGASTRIQSNGGDAFSSARISLINNAGYGTLLKAYYSGVEEMRLELRNATDTGFEKIYAAGFIVRSDKESKTDIKNMDVSMVDAMRKAGGPKKYHRKRDDDIETFEEIGLIAQEQPDFITTKDGKGIDMYHALTMAIGTSQELIDEIDRLKEEMAELRKSVRGKIDKQQKENDNG